MSAARRSSPRRCILLAALVAAALAAPARAQVIYVAFKDARTAKHLEKNCIVRDGAPVLVGEIKAGVNFDGHTFHYQGDKGNNEFWVVDTSDPAHVPYDVVDGKPAPSKAKGAVVTLKGAEIQNIQFLMRSNSLYGLAREYAQRKAALADLQKSRDATKKGSPEWMLAHGRYVGELERLATWLQTTIYPEAAKKLEKEVVQQRKVVAKEAAVQRLTAALASIKVVPTPPKLTELAKTLNVTEAIHVQESVHLRATYLASLTDERVKELLEIGEKIIDAFRVAEVDPYLGDDFKDRIPDTPIVEFWFGPSETNAHEHFLTDWYGLSWGSHKAERLAALAGSYRRKQPPEYLEYWKIADNKDFEAIVAHDLGHVLANLHWNDDRPEATLPEFLSEGLGYDFALDWLGRNSVTCKEFVEEQYAKPKGAKEAERSLLMGELEIYTQSALKSGPPCDTLIKKQLAQMGDADLAKSWSFLEFVLTKTGKPGQLWLRGLCDLANTAPGEVKPLRALTERLFGIENQDAFKVLDERWRAHAEELQKTGAPEPKNH
jgi:hypothetical protein